MLEILTYPDPRLKVPNERVETFDSELAELLDAMALAMKHQDGIGLAAPQVAQPLRLFIVDLGETEGGPHRRYEFINPRIVSGRGNIILQEGCLSLPGVSVPVKRFREVRVEYQDREGGPRKLEAHDLLAVAIQHEYDHLEGTLLIDHVPFWKRYFVRRKVRPNSKTNPGVTL